MARIESSVLVNAAPGLVRARADELANAAEFTNGELALTLQDAVAVSGARLKGTLSIDGDDMPFVAEVTEAGIERMVWATVDSRIPLRWEIVAKGTPDGSRVTVSLETGNIAMPGSRAEQKAIRSLQDMTENYVLGLRASVEEGAAVDLTTRDSVTA